MTNELIRTLVFGLSLVLVTGLITFPLWIPKKFQEKWKSEMDEIRASEAQAKQSGKDGSASV